MKQSAVLVTGASRGIGRATAERLASSGRFVVGLARSPGDGAFPGYFHAVDLEDREATGAALEVVTERFEFSGLVNNMGFNIGQPLETLDLATFERIVDLNVRTSIQCALAVLPGMRERRKGRIVNVSSRALLGREGHSSYSAAKAALIGLTRTWALELAPHGITANVVAPGQTATEMFRKANLIDSGAPRGRPLEYYTNRIPMRRLGDPDEIASAIEYFLSDGAAYVTGQVLYVCGGLSIGNVAP